MDVTELTISYFEDGQEVVKELDKEILSKGAWATILYRYIEWDRRKEEYGDEKFSIRRYQKRDGEYKPKSKFNISSKAQAEKIVETLSKWLQEEPESEEE
jgi:hypothetical protein